MNLKTYITDGRQFQHLSEIRQVGVANAMLNGVEIKRDEVRRDSETRPQICNDDFRKDIRWKLGFVAALNWVLDLPGEAQKYLDHLPDK